MPPCVKCVCVCVRVRSCVRTSCVRACLRACLRACALAGCHKGPAIFGELVIDAGPAAHRIMPDCVTTLHRIQVSAVCAKIVCEVSLAGGVSCWALSSHLTRPFTFLGS